MHEEKLWKRTAGDAPDAIASLSLPRRTFLQLVGFSAAALTLESCRAPEQQIVPYLTQPAEMTPGVANWYASTCGGCSAACGVLVKVREGRPIKLEGNPEHPLSRGALCPMAHAMVFDLFDAERLHGPKIAGQTSDWTAVDKQVAAKLDEVRRSGKGVRIVTGSAVGPTLERAIESFVATFPDARHITYDAVSHFAIREAHRRTHGAPVTPGYRFDRARVVVSFDADFLGSWISPAQFTRAYSESRDVAKRRESAVRHIQVESRMSLTGANADRRITASPAETLAMIGALAHRLARRAGLAIAADAPELRAELAHEVGRIEAELWTARGAALVVAGANDSDAQQLVNLINESIGAYGATVDLAAASRQSSGDDVAIEELLRDMEAGSVGALIVSGVNPSYDLPASDRFNRAVAKIPLTISLNPRRDETSARMKFACPQGHFLESWEDASPAAGVASPVQPAIAPLFATRSAIESLLRWSGDTRTAHQAVRDTWRESLFPLQSEQGDFEAFWERSLHDGVFSYEQAAFAGAFDATGADAALASIAGRAATDSLVAVLYEKPSMRDGAHASSPWLQELPDPISRVTWDNYLCVAPELARARGYEEGTVVALTRGATHLELPVHIQPGQHAGTVAVALGYGRTSAGPAGSNVGVNAFALIEPGASRSYAVDGIALVPTGRVAPLATVQPHSSSEGRDLIRRVGLTAALAPATDEAPSPHAAGQMWHGPEYGDLKWGMVVDLNKCTGCSACVISCQAENNIPVVGREEVLNQREMHWIRIDRYIDGDEHDPVVGFQPVMCGQCDNATCENVCPVLATVHSSDGINMQVYNRCVGTRYCANNCALKARRFNWFDYEHADPMANLALNPDVTVRSRGVMEKCTFCVQRLQEAKIRARNEGRPVADGDVMTACQQSCPAQAITFGNVADGASDVAQRKEETRNYVILEEVNMQSALSYLASVRTTEEA